MSAFLTFFIIVTLSASLSVGFFVLKYTGQAFVTVPDWPIIIGVILITLGATVYLILSFLTRDSLTDAGAGEVRAVFEVPVKATHYAPPFFRYHPFWLFSQKSLAEATVVPAWSHRSWPSSVPVTADGLYISVIKKNFVAREDIAGITIMDAGRLGERIAVLLNSGAYYIIWLRVEEPETALPQLEESFRDLGYPVVLGT